MLAQYAALHARGSGSDAFSIIDVFTFVNADRKVAARATHSSIFGTLHLFYICYINHNVYVMSIAQRAEIATFYGNQRAQRILMSITFPSSLLLCARVHRWASCTGKTVNSFTPRISCRKTTPASRTKS